MNAISMLILFLAIPVAVYLALLAWSLCRAAADRLAVREDMGEYE